MKPVADKLETKDIIEGGSRIAIILSGSPLFSGQAGSGESEIRKWIIENDLLEGIVAMPDQMFYNTGIGTFIWIISNRKPESAKGIVRLIDAREMGTKMRKALGDKRKELTLNAINTITELYANALLDSSDIRVKVMKNESFGYAKLTVERPLRRIWRLDELTLQAIPAALRLKVSHMQYQNFTKIDEAERTLGASGLTPKEVESVIKAIAVTDESADISINKNGLPNPDPDLRDYEIVPISLGFLELPEKEKNIELVRLAEEHLQREIAPYIPDAWIDNSKTKVGFEIPFMRQFYNYKKPRPIADIRSELFELESTIQSLMRGLN